MALSFPVAISQPFYTKESKAPFYSKRKDYFATAANIGTRNKQIETEQQERMDTP
jgi:hypothetical protein